MHVIDRVKEGVKGKRFVRGAKELDLFVLLNSFVAILSKQGEPVRIRAHVVIDEAEGGCLSEMRWVLLHPLEKFMLGCKDARVIHRRELGNIGGVHVPCE